MNALFIILRALFGITQFARITKTQRYFYFLFNVIFAAGIGALFILTPIPLILLAVFVIQRAVVYRVRKMMRVKAGDQADDFLPERKPQEVLSPTVPTFVTSTADSSIEKFADLRERIVTGAQADFHRRLRKDTLLAFGYFGLIFVYFGLSSLLNNPDQGIGLAVTGLFVGAFLLISVLLRWIFMRNLYRPQDSRFELVLLKNPLLLFGQELSVLLHKGGTNLLTWLLIGYAVTLSFSEKDWLSFLGLLSIGGIYAYRLLRPGTKAAYNIKLLVLRTFNIRENSLFTFGRLIQYWEHVGNYFTVVDSTFLKHKYRFMARRTLNVILSIQVLWLLISLGLSRLFHVPLFPDSASIPWGVWFSPISILCAVLATLLVIAFEFFMIQRNFIKTREQARERLGRIDLRPRGLTDFTFRGVPTMCHANTWKATVAEMAKRTDIVLMDLRGFSEKKNGCKDEVNFLLDNIDVNRLLILIGTRDDAEFIRRSILEQWRELKTDSPNLSIANPQIQIYKSDAQDETDVQGIFDHLIGAAVLSGRAQGVPAW